MLIYIDEELEWKSYSHNYTRWKNPITEFDDFKTILFDIQVCFSCGEYISPEDQRVSIDEKVILR